MTREIYWFEPAIRSLRSMPWRDAARIDASVQHYATTGEGEVMRLPSDNAVTIRLRIGSYSVRMTLDEEEGLLSVWSVYRH